MTTIERSSGILLHITSLPSRFGIGDLGPEAYRFANFLHRAKQRLWQTLPLNPIHHEGNYSPYSSWSAFAGNTLLISPEMMVQDGFLPTKDLEPIPGFKPGRTDFLLTEKYKTRLFDIAFDRFKTKPRRQMHNAFRQFCFANQAWLHDAVRFAVLKSHFKNTSWRQWPDEIKWRRSKALKTVDRQFKEALIKEKFLQFLFDMQWQALRSYCNNEQIQLFGDIPIYVIYNSADVWSQPDLFKLDDQLRPDGVSGVPPDYFSATGQLWGHPVYRWDRLKSTGYEWWLERIRHNLAYFDWIRIDHFRGLVAFWEVPADHTSAIKGKWVKASADEFLACLFRRFPLLPLVAEDLGAITADVRETIRRFEILGMRVALFAFGQDFPQSPYLPHNMERHCVFLTGSHDTNTVKGWFQSEATVEEKQRLYRYLGYDVPVDQVHWVMIRLVMQSTARIALIPLQDIFGLGKTARMNRPGKALGNWRWRFSSRRLTGAMADQLAELTETFGRG
ncbi:MAG: 4-alpha-glucanotransferase [Desulfobacterales bacterium]|jgi:4-alpha-glucanotransferase|nr:4-alpha-glucanotransferase [Desulfobacterales bacterium]MDD3081302.1 4-alpha-glucanotransferase [Desulfobacterales bacterium]MDD3950705.1 4-alpha-glucanotransferase [Desulfobacterales bacterium]